MNRRVWPLIVGSVLLFTCLVVSPVAATLVQQTDDFPPFLMVRVPFAPTPVPGDDGVHLVYELHVTNIDPGGKELTGLLFGSLLLVTSRAPASAQEWARFTTEFAVGVGGQQISGSSWRPSAAARV